MEPPPAPHGDDVVVFRPRRSYLLLIAAPIYLAIFGALSLAEALVHSRDLPYGARAVIALVFTLAQLARMWISHYRQPWILKVSPAGLDLRSLRTDQPVHIPWPAITSIRLYQRRLEVAIVPAKAGEAFDNPWKQAKLGDHGPDGQLFVRARMGGLRPGLFRLGVELARHLPAEKLTR
jgi:hypothetical protein